jgi:hypothetical protein
VSSFEDKVTLMMFSRFIKMPEEVVNIKDDDEQLEFQRRPTMASNRGALVRYSYKSLNIFP